MKRPDLTLEERYLIHHAALAGFNQAETARMLRRSASCINTELKRGQVRGRYCPHAAQRRHDAARWRCGQNAPGKSAALWAQVKRGLKAGYTPDEIAGRLVHKKRSERLCSQAIYRGIQRYQWGKWLKSSQRRRHLPRPARRPYQGRAQPIGRRGEAAALRHEMGHIEADSMLGKRQDRKQVIVMVDRQSLYTALILVVQKRARRVAGQIQRHLASWGLPFESITTDRGWEFTALGDVFPDKAYVCDPHQPNQRGTNENQIGRLRIDLPKGVSMNNLRTVKLKRVADKHNHTPRKALGYRTPFEVAFNRPSPVRI